MLSFFRNVSKSKIGTGVLAFVLIAILAGFAIGDIQNFGTGDIGFGSSSSTIATVGDEEINDREMSDSMQRRLQDVRQQQPDADYATIAGDFDTILSALLDQRAIIAFADKSGFTLSKRLVDAEIAEIPQAKGLNGKFSDQAYQAFLANQRLTDAQVRQIIAGNLLQRMILTPVAANARVSVGMARPYASMLLESREGEAAAIPLDAFRAGLKPSDADLQKFFAANRARYMIPEQRALRIARIGPQVPGLAVSPQEIAAYYNANLETYGARQTRSLTQALVPDQATAAGIAARAKAGATIAAAAAPAGANAAVTSVADQTRSAYAGAAGEKIAAAVFAAPAGAVVGPLQSDFGWVVVKIDGVKSQGGRSLAQAREEIAAKLLVDKRKGALEELVDKVQTAIDEGSNFAEAAAAARLTVTTTPLITANGQSRAEPSFRAPAELAGAIKAGFEVAANDPPEIVTVPNGGGYAMVAPAQVVPAAPPPLAAIRDRLAADWISDQSARRAQAAANAIAAKAGRGIPLAQAVREVGFALPPVRPLAARRIQIATAQGEVPPALRMLFTLGQGKSRTVPDPKGRGLFVVKVTKIVPGNAMLQPGLISQMQTELQQSLSDDYARQFAAAIRAEMKAKINESAVQAVKTRLATGAN